MQAGGSRFYFGKTPMLSRMVVNDGVGDNRAQNGLHGGQTFKGPVRHKGVPVKAQLVSNSTGSS